MTVAIERSTRALADQLITIQGGWEHFKLIQRGCEQTPGARLFYTDAREAMALFAKAIGAW